MLRQTLFLVSFLLCIFNLSSKEIPLIFQIPTQVAWETDWILEVLSRIDVQVIEDCKYEQFIDNSIIVISPSPIDQQYEEYFAKLRELNYKFGIIHLGDEIYSIPCDFYKNANFVIRCYWHKKYIGNPRVLTLPLGYKRGFWQDGPKELNNSFQREYVWSFAGQIEGKPSRQDMMYWLKQIPNHFIFETFAFGDPNSLPTIDYRDLLLKTIFVPCPRGFWNLDSFRICEALECGCIPIVEKEPIDYFAKFLGNHPFPTVASWDEAQHLIQSLQQDPISQEQLRAQCSQWWKDYKINLKNEVTDIVKNHLELSAFK